LEIVEASNKSLFLLFLTAFLLLRSSCSTLALDAARTSTTVRRGKSEVDVLLRVETNDERWHIDNLFADTDMSLPDQNASMVNALRKAKLEDLRLQPSLQEILDLERQHVIETHTSFVKNTNAHEPTNERISFEETLRVLCIELEQLTSSTTNFREDERDAPDFALVAQAVLAGKLQFGIETSRLERSTRDFVCLGMVPR